MKPGTGKKVLVAMSGGVDSSVTAALLQQQGYEVVGCFMRNGTEEEQETVQSPESCVRSPVASGSACASNPQDSGPRTPDSGPAPKNRQGCCSVNDAADARMVAALLGIPFYVMNFRKDFGRIKDYFTAEYNAGRTPNPCVRCNDWLKFGKLFDYAVSIDADFIATGHYARVEHHPERVVPASTLRDQSTSLNGSTHEGSATIAGLSDTRASRPPPVGMGLHPMLLRGLDHHKDQSYVLFGMKRDRLARMLLPIGHYHKPQVRELAQKMGLPIFDKPDSYEICFVPDNDYRGFLQRREPEAFVKGTIVDTAGQVIGEHEGHQHFTIGQRRGLPVNRSYPLYVIDKNAATNTVTLGPRDESNAMGLRADQTNWLIDDLPREPRRVTVKIRSNSEPVPATVVVDAEGEMMVRFDEAQHAVTPGQAAVCYEGEELIGGGWITQAL